MKTNNDRSSARPQMGAPTVNAPKHQVARCRSVACLGLAGLLALVIGSTADQAFAKGNFSVDNQSASKVRVFVYDGDDSVCWSKSKAVSVESQKTEDVQCHGGGKARCKIMVEVDHGNNICKDINRKACDDNVIRIIETIKSLRSRIQILAATHAA